MWPLLPEPLERRPKGTRQVSPAPTLRKVQAQLLGTAPGPGGERSDPGPHPERPVASAILDCGPPVLLSGPLGHGSEHSTLPPDICPSNCGTAAKPTPRPQPSRPSGFCRSGPRLAHGPRLPPRSQQRLPVPIGPLLLLSGPLWAPRTHPGLSEAHPAPCAPDQVTPVTKYPAGLRVPGNVLTQDARSARRPNTWDARRTGGTRGGQGRREPAGERLAAARSLIP